MPQNSKPLMESKKILLLAGEGDSTHIVFHALDKAYGVHSVIIEGRESRKVFIRRRIKRLGFFTVAGQVLFKFIIVPALNIFSRKQIAEYLLKNNLDNSEIPESKIKRVNSVNDKTVASLVEEIKPDVIVVNGTRIISKKLLAVITCPIINTHAGITPMYRGVHGAYWALVNKDEAHCGVTVHMVDAGIDTGKILYQDIIAVNSSDNFVTYPSKQLAAGVPLLLRAVDDALNNKIILQQTVGKSNLWYHPTIWQYFYYRLFRNVK